MADAYAGANDSRRRRTVSKKLFGEDAHLPKLKRDNLNATIRDQIRNFAIAQWMVRKHLDYVTRFNFQCQTDDEDFNSTVEKVINRRSGRSQCDASTKHPLRRLLRICEARAVVDGDILIRRLNPKGRPELRGRVQLIESELIDSPKDAPEPRAGLEWVSGVLVDSVLRPLAYGICERKPKRMAREFKQAVHARDCYLHGYTESSHRVDQVRGVSPIASGINSMRDVYEGFDWALLRVKIAQMFGLKITKAHDSEDDEYNPKKTGDDGDSATESEFEYDIKLAGGPFQLELNPGDDAAFLESHTPTTETVEFLQLMIHVVIKCLDLPYSFYREDFTNFFGSRAALLHYLRSAMAKIEQLQELLDWLTQWWLGMAVVDGELVLPEGMDFYDLRWEWVPAGVPWWDPSKEIAGNIKAVSANMDNVVRICRATGTDFYENARINAQAFRYAESVGAPMRLETASFGADDPGGADPDGDKQDDDDDSDNPEHDKD